MVVGGGGLRADCGHCIGSQVTRGEGIDASNGFGFEQLLLEERGLRSVW